MQRGVDNLSKEKRDPNTADDDAFEGVEKRFLLELFFLAGELKVDSYLEVS